MNDLPSVGTEDAPSMANYTFTIVADSGYESTTEGRCSAKQYGAVIYALHNDASYVEQRDSLAAERDELASRVAELEAEVLDQCRLNGMGAERESALMGRVRELESAALAAQPGAVGFDEIETVATNRYKVVPSHESMFHRFALAAGDGTQQLYLGREVECQNMAAKFTGAFLDGAFYALRLAAAPTEAKPAQRWPVSQDPLTQLQVAAIISAKKGGGLA